MESRIIVIGGSAGAIPILLDLAQALPYDLQAAVFIVQHLFPDAPSDLPGLMSRRGPLPAYHPLHGDPVKPGRIYVAPPDNHLKINDGVVEVARGAKESGHRPSVDTLFRSASTAYGSKVIGVVLSGYQDCGSVGLLSVVSRGGIGIVQDPQTAEASSMPHSAIVRAKPQHVIAPGELASLLCKLVAEPAPPKRDADPKIEALERATEGALADLVCPTCQGTMVAILSDHLEYFRCHVGHRFSAESLSRAQDDYLESALWAAVRALEETAALSQRVASRSDGEIHRRLQEKARTQKAQAKSIEAFLLKP